MRRFSWVVLAAIVLLASCSSSDTTSTARGSATGGDASQSAPDPVAAFCERFDVFAEFSDQDREPTEELIDELLQLQADVDEFLPEELASDWQALDDWFQAFIDVLERDGYGPVTEETFVAAFGDLEAADEAGERTEAAYQAIYDWQGTNCPTSESDQAFCEQWPPFEQLINSDPEVDEQLVGEVLAMEERLQAVVPRQIAGDLAVSVDWNARFIEWFERNNYRQAETDEQFIEILGGDESVAQEMTEARETAFASIESWIDANCEGREADPLTDLAVRFCAAWDDFAALTADEADLDEGQFEQLQEIIDRANAGVPAPVADDWAAISDFVDRYGDVLVSVEFREERITDQMLEQAFGSVAAYDDAVAARDAAGSAIAAWSLEGCGDFCARWSDMDRVTAELGYWLQWVVDDPDNGPARLEDHLRTLDILDQLATDEILDTWTAISAAYREWVDAWRQAGFDPEVLERSLQDGAVEWARTTPYLVDRIQVGPEEYGFHVRVLEAWQAGADEVPDWVYERWAGGGFDPERVQETREEIEASDPGFFELIHLFERDELPAHVRELVGMPPADLTADLMQTVEGWVDENCEVATGRPGTLRVRWPRVEALAGGTVVMAVVPFGGTHDDLADVAGTLATWCEEVNRDPWGVWIEQHQDEHGELFVEEGRFESDFFRDERWSEDRVCGLDHEAPPPRLDAGRYTLVGGIMWGTPEDPAVGIDLVSCLAIDVQIDGDTIVDLPQFQPCDVRIGGGEPDPWRHPPRVDSSTPGAGTLKVLMPELTMPRGMDGQEGGEFSVLVLPAGATLNEVGRQQIWPAAAIRTWLPPAGSDHAAELSRQGSASVPLAALPPSGRPVGLDPDWLASGPPDDKLPLTMLGPGAYDVRFEIVEHAHEHEERVCAQTEVTIDGDTVIDLPELGDCP